MSIDWKRTKTMLADFSCIQNVHTKELSIFGKYGEIWARGSSVFGALIRSPRIAKRYLPKEKWPVQVGDEIQISFNASELALWVERLLVPTKSTSQAKLANHQQSSHFRTLEDQRGGMEADPYPSSPTGRNAALEGTELEICLGELRSHE